MRIGLIADTHGLLRPQALEALAGAGHILHAGDIGAPGILDALAALAPVTAVRGNNDTAPWALALPETATLELAGLRIHLLHDLAALDRARLRADVVVAGHSHRPRIAERDGRLEVNPGSAGRRRFSLPVSLGWLEVVDGRACARIVELEV